MTRGEIVINEERCNSCGYCQIFCSRGCIKMDPQKIGPRGGALPVFIEPEKCNACAVCGWMCPEYAIEVYKSVEEAAKLNSRLP